MRSMNLRMMISFITRQHALDINVIRSQVVAEHEKCLELHPSWNLKATRRLVIANYWFQEASRHFSAIIGFALLFTLPQFNGWLTLFASILLASVAALFSLTAFIYFPSFFLSFMPRLEMIIGEQEKLAAQSQETTKCKRTQFQAPTLIIIYYVNSKTGNLPLLPANDQSAEHLNKLYGSDKDKLKQNLSRLYKLSSLSAKERAEMLKGVENARGFFKDTGNATISKILDELEFKLRQ
jgi:hypothetical protein